MHTKLCTCRTKQITAGFRSYMFFPSSYYALLLKQTKSNKMKSAKQNKIEILSTCFSIQKCRNCCSVIALKQLSPIRLAWDLGLLPKITEGDGEAQGDSKQLRDLLQCNNLLYYCLLKPFVYMPFLAPDCYSYLAVWLLVPPTNDVPCTCKPIPRPSTPREVRSINYTTLIRGLFLDHQFYTRMERISHHLPTTLVYMVVIQPNC